MPLAVAVAAVLALPAVADAATTIGQSTYPPGQTIEFREGPGVFAQVSWPDGVPSYEVPAGGGVITSWSLVTGGRNSFTDPYTLELLQPGQGNSYTVAARDPEHITTSADGSPALSTFPVRIPVSGGELLAVWDGSAGTPGTLGLQDTANMSDGAGQDTNQPTDPPAGSSVGFGLVEFEARLLLSAQLEPDADHDGYGDETQDQCPTDAATQGPCPLVTPPPADKTPPAFSASISKLLKLSKSGAISFTLTSGENATGTATGTVSLPRTSRVVRFKTAKFSLSAGKRTKVTLKLPKSALKKVRSALRHHRLKAKLTITAKDAAGNQTVKKLSAKLKH